MFLALAQVLPPATVPRVTAQWLGEINLFLAAFNLLPGFPLDGGRVLRAIVWGITQNVHTATRVASLAGAGFGILLIIFGAVQFIAFRGLGVQALWAIFIGWFLWSAARSALREGAVRRRLSSMVVRDVTRAFTQAPFPHDAVVAEAESSISAESAPPVWPVADAAGDVFAMVATRDIAAVPRSCGRQPAWAMSRGRSTLPTCWSRTPRSTACSRTPSVASAATTWSTPGAGSLAGSTSATCSAPDARGAPHPAAPGRLYWEL